MTQTVRVEGLRELERKLLDLPKATGRNVLRRVLAKAGQPIADRAAAKAPVESGILSFSIAVSPTLTRRHRGAKVSEVEMHIGPAGGMGALSYASFVEFGTVDTAAKPYLRPAWDALKDRALDIIKSDLGAEIERSASRIARRAARRG